MTNRFFAIFGKTVGHQGLKFGTGSFLTRIYNFFIKIFVGGRLDNNTKMLTNITTKKPARRTS